MATSGNERNVSVLVKTANGSVEDLNIECERKWCLFDLKVHLSTVHPSRPPVRSQKLIHSGRIVSDETPITNLESSSGITLHLVVSPSRSNSLPVTSNNRAPPQPVVRERVRPRPVATPSATSNGEQANNNGGETNSTHQRHTMTAPGHGTPVPPQFPQGWPHPYMMSPYYAAQMTQWYQMMYNNPNWRIPPQTHQHTNPDNPVGGAGGVAPAPPEPEADQDNDDIAMNAGGGMMGGLMADNRQRRDLVDYAYMLLMLFFLGTMGYLSGSIYQFAIFGVGVALILMNQGGWFRLQRRQLNQNPPPPPPPVRPNPLRREDNEAPVEGEDPPQEQQEAPPPPPEEERRGFFGTLMTLITSFFTSLVPQQLPELAND